MSNDWDSFIDELIDEPDQVKLKPASNEKTYPCGQCAGTGLYSGPRVHQEKKHCFVVFKGSEAKAKTTPSCHEYLITLRKQLIANNILAPNGDRLIFTENYVFNSPSTAGGVILGRSTNGWTTWKSKDGKTLDELKRR